MFHVFFPLLAGCYIILFVQCVYNIYIYIMYSWTGISLVLCFRGGSGMICPWFHWGLSRLCIGEITLDPLPIDHQVSSCWLVGWLHFLWLGRTETCLKLGLWLLAMFPLFRCCMFCFLLRPMRFWMVSEQCGGNFKATTRFYWVRSEGVDRFVVDWCWVGGFASFGSFPETWLRLPCPRCTC